MSPSPIILVVDDEHLLREAIAQSLLDEGHIVLTASNAREAIQYLSNEMVDLLITDIVMPGGMDGFQLAQKAKSMRPNLRVIYMSGYYSSEARGAAPIFGPIMHKPFRTTALLDEVGRTAA